MNDLHHDLLFMMTVYYHEVVQIPVSEAPSHDGQAAAARDFGLGVPVYGSS